jgi:hypothetical protein
MKIDVQGMRRRKGVVLDDAAGAPLCVLAGGAFSVAECGWKFTYFDPADVRTRLNPIKPERSSQISEVGTVVHVLKMRLAAVCRRLEQVQALTRGHLESPDLRVCAIGSLKTILNGDQAHEKECARSGRDEAR